MRNVECKASDPYPGSSLEPCIGLGADGYGMIWARDTYFDVARWRLKLREEQPGRPHLIRYERADERLVPRGDAEQLLSQDLHAAGG
jgi:hypothetical protein